VAALAACVPYHIPDAFDRANKTFRIDFTAGGPNSGWIG
jgi:hypothetical protein